MFTREVQSFVDDMELLIAFPGHVFQPIIDISKAVYESFSDCDINVDFKGISGQEDLNKIAQSGNYSHILSINTHDYLEKDRGFFLEKPKYTRMMTYNLEQTPIKNQNSYWAAMRLNEVGYYGPYFDYIVSESYCKSEDIQNMGFNILHLNIPYHPSIDLNVNHKVDEKEYDVFFVGCGSERRQQLINRIQEEGMTVAPATMPMSLGRHYKSEMVRKSRVCLNVHFSEMEYFEKPRILYDYMINKGVVVSEKILYPECFEHLKHIFMVKYPNIIPMLVLLLNKYNEDTLKIGEMGYNQFKQEHHYSKLVPQFLTQLFESERSSGRIR